MDLALVGTLDLGGSWQQPTALADVDGDGVDELAFLGSDPAATSHLLGAVSVFRGPVGEAELATADVLSVTGEDAGAGSYDCAGWTDPPDEACNDGDGTGSDVAAADVDGDGLLDLLVGSPGEDDGGAGRYDAGSVRVWRGPFTVSGALLTSDEAWTGAASGTYLGAGFSVGDLDGDGRVDVLAPDYDEHGVARWFTPGSAGRHDTDEGVTLEVGLAYDRSADYDVGDDWDGDGIDEVTFTQRHDDIASVWIFAGPAGDALDHAGADAVVDTPNLLNSPSALRGLGDADGDGRDDPAWCVASDGFSTTPAARVGVSGRMPSGQVSIDDAGWRLVLPGEGCAFTVLGERDGRSLGVAPAEDPVTGAMEVYELDPDVGATPVDTFDLGLPSACMGGGFDWSGDGVTDLLCWDGSGFGVWGEGPIQGA